VDYTKGIEQSHPVHLQRQRGQLNDPKGGVYNAISGDRIILSKGDIASNLPERDSRQPRTSIGIDQQGKPC
jgi:hypothetical protein